MSDTPADKSLNILELKNQLNHKQVAFAQAYVKSGNGKQAAINAGYAPTTAGNTAIRLVRHPVLRAYMEALIADPGMDQDVIADAAEIQALLTSIGRGNTSDVYVVPREGIQFAQTHSRERVKALEVLAKIKGLMVDNVNVSANERIQVINDLPAPRRKTAQKKEED